MLSADSVMQVDAAAPSTEGAGGSFGLKKSETSEHSQILQLQAQAQELLGKALELTEQARRIENDSDPEAQEAAEQAKQQAQTMRSTAEQVSREIHAAPTDKDTGRKKISPGRVASLSATIEHVRTAGEKEKAALIEANDEAVKHAKIGKSGEHIAKQATKNVIQRVTRYVEEQIPSRRTVSAGAVGVGVGGGLGWQESFMQRASSAIEQARTTTQTIWSGITSTVSETYEAVVESAPVRAMADYGRRAVDGVATFVADPGKAISAAVDTVSDTASKAAAVISDGFTDYVANPAVALAKSARETALSTYAAAEKAASEQLATARKAASEAMDRAIALAKKPGEWVANLWNGDDAAPKVAKASPASTTTKPAMAKAMREAMALSLPATITGQGLADAFIVTFPNAPGHATGITQIIGFN
jgi:hypothetical protein